MPNTGDNMRKLPKRELLAYRVHVKGQIFRQIRKVFNELGISQKALAEKLGVDEGMLSRRLKGKHDMRLETLSDLARGLDCRIEVKLTAVVSARVAVPALSYWTATENPSAARLPLWSETSDVRDYTRLVQGHFDQDKPQIETTA